LEHHLTLNYIFLQKDFLTFFHLPLKLYLFLKGQISKTMLKVFNLFTLFLFFSFTSKISAQAGRLTEDASIDVNFYHLEIDVAIDSQYINSKLTCEFKALKPTHVIKLDLADGLKVKKIDGAKSFWHRNNQLEITFESVLTVGKYYSMSIFYAGRPPKATDGLVSKGMIWEKHGKEKNIPIIATLSTPYLAHFWYPCKDGPADKADSVYVDITIPNRTYEDKPLIGVSNGVLEDSVITEKNRTYKWRHRYPIVPYYLLVAVSNYHREIVNYEDPNGLKYPLEFFFFPETYKESMVMVRRMPDIMTVLTEVFGAYPYAKEKYGMTQIGFYSAIETQTNAIMNNLEGRSIPTAVHEAAHQWFANSITCVNWSHAWINEGMASYSEALWREYKNGVDKYHEEMKTNLWLKEGSLFLKQTDNPFRVFTPIVYQKSTWVLHMLRHVMTDKYFFELLRKTTADVRFRHKHISTEDFQGLAEKISLEDLESFFKQWIYGEFYPVYDYSYTLSKDKKKLIVNVNQLQRETSPSFFIMPIDFHIKFTTGKEQVARVSNNLPNQTFEIDLNQADVKDVLLDPENWILKEVKFRRSILNTKIPFVLHEIKSNNIGRKITLNVETSKKQDIKIQLLNTKGESSFSTTKSIAAGKSEVVIEIADDKAADGEYTLKLVGASDEYLRVHKLL
jgi:aminopeptidase N